MGVGRMLGVASMRWPAPGHVLECTWEWCGIHHERRGDSSRGRNFWRAQQPHDRYCSGAVSGCCCRNLDRVGQAMRVHAHHLGQVPASCPPGVTIPGYCPPAGSPAPAVNLQSWCQQNGMTYDPSKNACAPAPPVGTPTATGAIPGNTSGNTNPTVPSDSSDLCTSQGGTWDGTICNYNALCNQFPFGGVYDIDTGTCDYSQFYWIAGLSVAALLLLVLASSGGRRGR